MNESGNAKATDGGYPNECICSDEHLHRGCPPCLISGTPGLRIKARRDKVDMDASDKINRTNDTRSMNIAPDRP